MNTFVLNSADLVTSSGLSDIVSFFNTQSVNNDVAGSLLNASLAFKISMGIIMFIGALAMAIWIGRIAVDILLIATRGMGKLEKLANFGTGKADSYSSVANYLKGNLLEIVMVIVLIAFLMTGWLFRLIAIAISGFGMLANKLFNLDVNGGMSKLSAQSFKEGVDMMRVQEQKAKYDEELGAMKSQSDILYQYASEGKEKDSSTFITAQRAYTVHMARANYLSTKLESKSKSLNLNKAYFKQHIDSRLGCNSAFYDATVGGYYDLAKSPTCK